MSNACTCPREGEQSDDSFDEYDEGDDDYDENDEKNVDAVAAVEGKAAQKQSAVNKAKSKKLVKRMPTPQRFGGGVSGGAPSSSMDDVTDELDEVQREQRGLVVSKKERQSATVEFKQELRQIANKRKDAKSGVALSKRVQVIRKRVVSKIIASAQQIYATEDDEYAAIGKFYRGMFRKVAYNDCRPRKDRLFDDGEKEILEEIARAYGAFGY